MIKSHEKPSPDSLPLVIVGLLPFTFNLLERVVCTSWTHFLISQSLPQNYSNIPLKFPQLGPQDWLFLNIMDKVFILLDQSATLNPWNTLCMGLCYTTLSWSSFYLSSVHFGLPLLQGYCSSRFKTRFSPPLTLKTASRWSQPLYMALLFKHVLMLLKVLSLGQSGVPNL